MASGFTTLRDSLLPAVDIVRGLPGQLGLRPFGVNVVSRTWTGPRPGLGTSSDTVKPTRVDLGTFSVNLRLLTSQEIIASNSLYEQQDVEIGPITPPYTGSSVDNDAISIFDPPVGSTGFELLFKVTGPGYATTGTWFRKVSQNVTRNFRYTFVLRQTGEQP